MRQGWLFIAGIASMLFVVAAFWFGRVDSAPYEHAENSSHPRAALVDAAGPSASKHEELENLHRVSERLYSGGQPEGDSAFARLRQMGIEVVVSVDGARPDVEAARRHGLRYVHIPLGYDGVPEEARLGITRAVREAQGPIYIHCHHGRHRGPAAAAIAYAADGGPLGDDACGIMEKAGTGKEYAGLWRDVKAFEPPGEGVALPELVESADVDPFVRAMVEIDRHFEPLSQPVRREALPEDQRRTHSEHATLLVEGFREARRSAEDGDETMRQWLEDALRVAEQFSHKTTDTPNASISTLTGDLKARCKRCHQAYRDGE